jgi:hypothetical protein
MHHPFFYNPQQKPLLFGFLVLFATGCSQAESLAQAEEPVQANAQLETSELHSATGPEMAHDHESEMSSPIDPETNTHCIRKPISPEEAAHHRMRSKFAPGGNPLPIYLNRNGGTFSSGWNDSSANVSSIAYDGAVVPSFDGSNADWATIKSCVTEGYSAFNLWITDQQPTSGEYIQVVVGGHPSDIGVGSGVGGISPYNCDVIPKSIVFVFSENLYGNQNICEVILHEVGHSLSLDHEYLCEDPMTYLSGCGNKTFQNQDAQCGEYSQRSCDCNRNTQNSVEILTQNVGLGDGLPPPDPEEDEGPPSAEIVAPNDGAVLAEQSQIQVVAQAEDDLGLTSVVLVWDFNGETYACPSSSYYVSCTVNGPTYTWSLDVGTGSRTFHVEARDVAGNTVQTTERTVTLGQVSDDPQDPPPSGDDTQVPVVEIVAPMNQAELPANNEIQVVAVAVDDIGIASVELEWDYSDESFPCPTNQNAVSCTRNGSTYTWTINVGTGQRDYRVRATDGAQNTVVSASQTLFLTSNGSPPSSDNNDSYENNNTWDFATAATCDQGFTLRMEPGDHDWFVLSVTPGMGLKARAEAALGESVELYLTNGPHPDDILATDVTQNSIKEVAAVPSDQQIGIHVAPMSSTESFDYELWLTCIPGDEVDNGGSDDGTDGDTPPIPPKDPNAPPEDTVPEDTSSDNPVLDNPLTGDDSGEPANGNQSANASSCTSHVVSGESVSSLSWAAMGLIFFCGWRRGRKKRA